MYKDIVTVSHVQKIYQENRPDQVVAVNDVSFSIKAGETFGLVGESGSGKSTTGKLLMGLEEATAGDIQFMGQDVAGIKGRKNLLAFRKNIQMIFQDPFASLNPRMTVGEIIGGPMRVHGLVKSKRDQENAVRDLMVQVGLDPAFINRYPREFSGGQCQRVGIARALALQPKLIIADEAISALDVSIQAQIVNLLKQLKITNELTYMFITHDLSMVKYISDRIGVMSQGRLVELASAEDIYNNPLHDYTKSLLSAIPTADPISEKTRQRSHFDGVTYTTAELDGGDLFEITPDHYVYCHPSEIASYQAKSQSELVLI